ncbi:hypothetical protein C2E25_16805 [Geothermobacter hydrogeniphilus]|uniref:AAA ATPase domain-containing protein n=1 Tax=Geothermobacter hydrogeniphilus TaxID=1969733 RepID=A0A2K2H5S1_9BACT|nr:AAA family ATPase [Geothermobacter hydrogeniphilus]PNU18601.1 hypothetical protein C2E25_16805 [Geothermobacter hydrogeniphilus]
MVITAITIENFKGIKDPVRVEFKPITLLFGPNSAGKSTIVQALHYAREVLGRQNLDADRVEGADESMNLGGFRNLVYGHDTSRTIKISFDLDVDDVLEPFLAVESPDDMWDWFYGAVDQFDELSDLVPLETHYDVRDIAQVKTARVSFEVAWSELFGRPYLKSYGVGFDGSPFADIVARPDGKEVAITNFNYLHPSFLVKTGDEPDSSRVPYFAALFVVSIKASYFKFRETTHLLLEDQTTALPHWGQQLRIAEVCLIPTDERDEGIEDDKFFDQMVNGLLSQLLVRPGEALLKALEKVKYIGPIRKTPPRNFNLVRSADSARWTNGLAAWDHLYLGSDEFVEEVGEWMGSQDLLDSGFSLKVGRYKKLDINSPLYASLVSASSFDDEEDRARELEELPEERDIVLFDESRQVQVFPQDIGIGISQLLPVVVGALDAEIGTLVIEQPELHLHPGLQCRLGDLFVHQAHEQSGKMFLLETHSEHLLLRLMRRIRETSEEELPVGHPGLRPDQLSVNYIDWGAECGTRICQLQIGDDGDSCGEWPEGFFEERAEELF